MADADERRLAVLAPGTSNGLTRAETTGIPSSRTPNHTINTRPPEVFPNAPSAQRGAFSFLSCPLEPDVSETAWPVFRCMWTLTISGTPVGRARRGGEGSGLWMFQRLARSGSRMCRSMGEDGAVDLGQHGTGRRWQRLSGIRAGTVAFLDSSATGEVGPMRADNCVLRRKALIPVRLRDIVEEMGFPSEESSLWLERSTGTSLRVSDFAFRRAEDEASEETAEREDGEAEEVEWARKILSEEEDFAALPSRWDIHEYRIMEDFIASLDDDRRRENLFRAIRGKGAFRSFRDRIADLGLLEDGFRYRDGGLRRIAIEWCAENGIGWQEE